MNVWKAKQIAARTEDGGFEGEICSCGAVVQVVAENQDEVRICKACATEAINTIDEFFIKEMKDENKIPSCMHYRGKDPR